MRCAEGVIHVSVFVFVCVRVCERESAIGSKRESVCGKGGGAVESCARCTVPKEGAVLTSMCVCVCVCVRQKTSERMRMKGGRREWRQCRLRP